MLCIVNASKVSPFPHSSRVLHILKTVKELDEEEY